MLELACLSQRQIPDSLAYPLPLSEGENCKTVIRPEGDAESFAEIVSHPCGKVHSSFSVNVMKELAEQLGTLLSRYVQKRVEFVENYPLLTFFRYFRGYLPTLSYFGETVSIQPGLFFRCN